MERAILVFIVIVIIVILVTLLDVQHATGSAPSGPTPDARCSTVRWIVPTNSLANSPMTPPYATVPAATPSRSSVGSSPSSTGRSRSSGTEVSDESAANLAP